MMPNLESLLIPWVLIIYSPPLTRFFHLNSWLPFQVFVLFCFFFFSSIFPLLFFFFFLFKVTNVHSWCAGSVMDIGAVKIIDKSSSNSGLVRWIHLRTNVLEKGMINFWHTSFFNRLSRGSDNDWHYCHVHFSQLSQLPSLSRYLFIFITSF